MATASKSPTASDHRACHPQRAGIACERMARAILGAAFVGLVACAAGRSDPAGPTLRLWHTFGPEETRALNAALAPLAFRVEPTVWPFGQARTRLAQALARGDCPDVARIDATWLPALA